MEFNLDKLKKQYEEIRKKHSLPSFKEMNEEFEIEKLQERESEILIREVRRAMLEKNSAYLRFIEFFLNPGNAPMFFFRVIKNLESESKQILEEIYVELGKYEVLSVKLDNIYDESDEASFINEFFKKWQEIKVKFLKLMKSIENSWEKKQDRKEKGYLG